MSYSGSFYRREYHRVVMPWKDAPLLQQLAWEVGGLLGLEGKGGGEGGGEIEGGEAPFSYVLLQHYRTMGAGIKAHRDKELHREEPIVGLSLGGTRKLVLTRVGGREHEDNRVEICLPYGSLYVLDPPTNGGWAHAIEPVGEGGREEGVEGEGGDVVLPRLSLTFRRQRKEGGREGGGEGGGGNGKKRKVVAADDA